MNYITDWGKGIGLSCRKCRKRWRATSGQDDIRREKLEGECRDTTEEEADERPYPEDPLDWPAPHQIMALFHCMVRFSYG